MFRDFSPDLLFLATAALALWPPRDSVITATPLRGLLSFFAV